MLLANCAKNAQKCDAAIEMKKMEFYLKSNQRMNCEPAMQNRKGRDGNPQPKEYDSKIGSFGVGLQEQASNSHKLLQSKAAVVNVMVKGVNNHVM